MSAEHGGHEAFVFHDEEASGEVGHGLTLGAARSLQVVGKGVRARRR
jgi:hypothetical protein